MPKNSVFISYCHSDFSKDEISRLDYIIESIAKASKSKYEIIWDRSHLGPGDDIDAFMLKAAEKCDAAILLYLASYILVI